MLILLALLAAAPSAGAWSIAERITPEMAATQVTQCGVAPVSIKVDQDSETRYLKLDAKGPLVDDQITCIAKAADPYYIELPTLADVARYAPLFAPRYAIIVKEQARKWLKSRGILARIPKYTAGEPNQWALYRRVERICNADGAFYLRDGLPALNPEWLQSTEGQDGDSVTCLINVALETGRPLRAAPIQPVGP